MKDRSRKNRGTESPYAEAFRRDLREFQTRAEELLWAIVRDRRLHGYKFRRQHSIDCHIVDFVCLAERLVIEVDGEYHDFISEKDLSRDRHLKALGFRVLRFNNRDVLTDAEVVARAITNALGARGELKKNKDER